MKQITVTQTKRGDITIRIPAPYIKHTVSIMENIEYGTRVTHTKTFSDAVHSEILAEDDAGSTPVHLMLDSVIESAINNGAEGVTISDDDT